MTSESGFNEYEGRLASLLNRVFRFMLDRGKIDDEIEVIDFQIRQYVQSHEPRDELIPLSSLEDLSPGMFFFLGLDLKINGDTSSLRGNFYVGEDNTFIPLIKDEIETDIDPEHVEEDGTLSERAVIALDTHWDRIWDIIKFAINVILQIIKTDLFSG